MTLDEMIDIYNDYSENSNLDDFKNMPETEKFHKREDLHAFLLLDKIFERMDSQVNKTTDIIQAAEHDAIYLSYDLDNIAETITKEEIISLAKAGVCFSEYDGLYMYV